MWMVTVLRQDGLRVMIFANDHLPAHVHVFGDGEAKIDLSEPAVVWADGMTRAELRRAFKVVLDNRLRLLARWKVIHG
jgi:hypothetical protein